MQKRFSGGFRVLRNVRALTLGAILIALQVTLAMQVTFTVASSIHITLDRCVLALNASILGPEMGMISGALADLIQCLLHGWVPNLGLTLNEMLAGLLYGLVLYRRPAPRLPGQEISLRRCAVTALPLLLAQAAICVAVNILLGTFWLHLMYGQPFWASLPARGLKNLAQYPVDVAIIWALLALRDRLYAAGALKSFL